MGKPLISSGGSGVPILHLVRIQGPKNGQNWTGDIDITKEWIVDKSFFFCATSGQGQKEMQTVTSDGAMNGVQFIKHVSNRLKLTVRGDMDLENAGDYVDIALLEVPTRAKVVQHRQDVTISNGSTNVDPQLIGAPQYAEGSPVIFCMTAGAFKEKSGGEALADFRATSFIKSDGTFDVYGFTGGANNQTYELLYQVIPI
jgi:hypothetical protein